MKLRIVSKPFNGYMSPAAEGDSITDSIKDEISNNTAAAACCCCCCCCATIEIA